MLVYFSGSAKRVSYLRDLERHISCLISTKAISERQGVVGACPRAAGSAINNLKIYHVFH